MAGYVGALDQGTTSTRFMVFDHDGREICRHQLEHAQLFPHPGWVEHDPMEILDRSLAVMAGALQAGGLTPRDLVAVGVANQRETVVVWDPSTGLPYMNAIVWQDTRTAEMARSLGQGPHGAMLRQTTGLPPASYFSAPKLRWALDHVEGLGRAAAQGRAMAGTIDSWLVWHLSGGPAGGAHLTEPTNASRTMLMDLATWEWSQPLLDIFGLPAELLPRIVPSTGHFGYIRPSPSAGEPAAALSGWRDVPITACLGDQQAALAGQVCLEAGEAKNTYGTGSFLLLNTGAEIPSSAHGLVPTACWAAGGTGHVHALEGSVAVTGSAVQWLRDQMGLVANAAQSEALASEVPSTEGVYFVPAFSGLFAPYWRSDARGTIVGLTRSTTAAHLARATLEAICYQTLDVLVAMAEDTGRPLECLKVDGGVTANALCMQMQADILGVAVSKPEVAETTALGAAYAAGLAVGFWDGPGELRANWREARRWEPQWDESRRQEGYGLWKKAVERSLDWETGEP